MSKLATKFDQEAEYARNADKLGELRASIKVLQDEAKDIENYLERSGAPVIEGEYFRVTISYPGREIVDWQAIARYVGFSSQLKTAHTEHKQYRQVRVSAHKK